jgi:hypothetical protein
MRCRERYSRERSWNRTFGGAGRSGLHLPLLPELDFCANFIILEDFRIEVARSPLMADIN